MRLIKIIVQINDKTGKIQSAEETILGLPKWVDKEVYLHGIYGYLWAKSCRKFDSKEILRIE